MRWRPLSAVALAVACTLGVLPALASPSGVSPDPHLPVGLLVRPYTQSTDSTSSALKLAHSAGVQAVTVAVPWYAVAGAAAEQPEDWQPLDSLIGSARRNNLSVTVQVYGTPAWVHPEIGATTAENTWYPPRGPVELSDWSNFIGDLVNRYGTQISAYELWNEPNLTQFWLPSPSPTEYAELLQAGYTAAKDANPNVTVEFGGLSSSDSGYLEAYYRAASSLSGAAAQHYFFDRMNVHPYTGGRLPDVADPWDTYQGPYGAVDTDFRGIASIKETMDSAGDPRKDIHIGEYGASTADTWMPAVSDSYRALMLKRAVRIASDIPYVSELDWYAYLPTSDDGSDWAIVSASMSPSLTFTALQQVLTASPVQVSVQAAGAPLGIKTLTGSVPLGISLSNGGEVVRNELYADGHLVASGGRSITWDTTDVLPGRHQVLAVAYTKDGSVWPGAPTSVAVENPTVDGVTGELNPVSSPSSVGASLTVTGTVRATTAGVLPSVVVAVRDATGRSLDFPVSHNVFAPLSNTSLTFSAPTPPAGVYQMWLAWSDGSVWRQLGPAATITVR